MWSIIRAALCIVVALSCFMPPEQSRAQIQAPEPINALLPETWRAPLAQFLRKLGAKDIEAMLDATRSGAYDRADILFLRIEHAATCLEDRCLTIVGQMHDATMHPRAMFYAGKWTTRGDVIPQFLGKHVPPPLAFFTTNAPSHGSRYLVLVETSEGWILSAEAM